MPNRSSHTTTGNWRARFASEFYDDQGRQWRVEFIDNDTASGHTEFSLSSTDHPHDVDLTDDGFLLSWDGPTDHLGGSVIPSTCTVEMVLTTNAMENIHSAIKGADDDRFGLAVYINDGSSDWVPWWVGSLFNRRPFVSHAAFELHSLIMGQIGFTFDQVFDDTQDTPFGQHIANRIQDRGGLVGQPLTQSGVTEAAFFSWRTQRGRMSAPHIGTGLTWSTFIVWKADGLGPNSSKT